MEKYFDEYFDMVYFVNLPHRTDRYENVMKMFNELNITNYTHIIPPKGAKPYLINGIDIGSSPAHNANSVSCKLSHIQIMLDAIENGYEHIMIFEDDFCFNQDNPEIKENIDYHLKACFDFMNNNNDWDMFYFDDNVYMHKTETQKPLSIMHMDTIVEYPHVAKINGKVSTHSYALSKNGIKNMLNLQLSNGLVLDHNYLFNGRKYNLYVYTPGIFDQLLDNVTDIYWTNSPKN